MILFLYKIDCKAYWPAKLFSLTFQLVVNSLQRNFGPVFLALFVSVYSTVPFAIFPHYIYNCKMPIDIYRDSARFCFNPVIFRPPLKACDQVVFCLTFILQLASAAAVINERVVKC